MNSVKKLIKVDSHCGFDRYVFDDQIDIRVGADGLICIQSPFGNKTEMMLTPSQCREALFEERDLWN